jgi:hypothetical protein
MYTTSGLGSMEISPLHVEAILAATKPRNQTPLLYSTGVSIVRGSDVTTFLHKYVRLTAFTRTYPSSPDAVTMFPYYCFERSDVQDPVVIIPGYVERDSAVVRTDMLGVFRYSDSQADLFAYARQYLEQLCSTLRDRSRGCEPAEFDGLDQTESFRTFLRTFNNISGVYTECRMMCEYDRTDLLPRALPK